MRINYKIRARELRVVDEAGNQVGVLEVQEALKRAQEAGLDLVEVAPDAKPPVARIMDYSKFKYEQEKKEREARKKQHIIHTKEVKVGPKIEEHDYQVKLHQIEKFLSRGDKVKVSMMFRGREMMHIELGKNVINRLALDATAVGELEFEPKLDGRMLGMVLRPKK
ncbi:MAG: translation initiation factor IF-3 [Candidatus Omnitrophica bacterium]|nr:translation initiation factor IF-3 [Candidatus Omnitrophota bacterium]